MIGKHKQNKRHKDSYCNHKENWNPQDSRKNSKESINEIERNKDKIEAHSNPQSERVVGYLYLIDSKVVMSDNADYD